MSRSKHCSFWKARQIGKRKRESWNNLGTVAQSHAVYNSDSTQAWVSCRGLPEYKAEVFPSSYFMSRGNLGLIWFQLCRMIWYLETDAFPHVTTDQYFCKKQVDFVTHHTQWPYSALYVAVIQVALGIGVNSIIHVFLFLTSYCLGLAPFCICNHQGFRERPLCW